MSLLAIQLPPRDRLGYRFPMGEAAPPPRPPDRWPCAFSVQGRSAGSLRLVSTSQLPKAAEVVLVVSASDICWHRVRVPKAPASRMRAALAGVLEEQILEAIDDVHLALEPGAQAGTSASVAVMNRAYLKSALAALDQAGVQVDRVVPATPPPGGPVRGHFSTPRADHAERKGKQAGAKPEFEDTVPWSLGGPVWTLVSVEGVWTVPLFDGMDEHKSGGLALALRDRFLATQPPPQWTATPSAAKAAMSFLCQAVTVQTPAEHLLEAAVSTVNLRQFDLAPRHRGLRALSGLSGRIGPVEWRQMRLGLVSLAALHVVGLNAYAMQQRHALESRRSAATSLLRSTYPSVRTVLDAPAQMRAETERLRAAAGNAGPADLEVLMAAAASAWPEGKQAIREIRFQAGQLSLSADDWRDDEVTAFRQALGAAGWTVEFKVGVLTLAHVRPGGGSP